MQSHAEATHVGGSTRLFLIVWFFLLLFTGIEVYLAYIHVPPLIMLTALVGLSVLKAALIIAYFMHLKFEKFSLFLTLFPMLIFCILLLFIFMSDSMRALEMRPQ
jgi:cytochrome c oxidase subunit 4